MTSQVVRKLKAKGLLERDTGPGDTRARRLRITPDGADLALRAIEHVERADAAFFRAVTNSDASTERVVAFLRLLTQPNDGAAQRWRSPTMAQPNDGAANHPDLA
jgi:DNA-binding MarR family transcriptional regulator